MKAVPALCSLVYPMATDSQVLSPQPIWRLDSGDSGVDWPAVTSRLSWYHFGKQVMDFMLALVLGVIAVPVILVAGLLVKLTSRGPALYSQARMGKGGKPFTIYKLRSMRHRCE